MLKAQVDDQPFLTCAGTYAKRYRNSRNDLQSVVEVPRPSHAGTQQQRVIQLITVFGDHRFRSNPDRLQHEVEARVDKIDKALPQVPPFCEVSISKFILCVRGNGAAN